MLTIIEGRSGAGKTTQLFDRIAAARTDESKTHASVQPIFLIVPDQSTLQYEDRLMLHLNVEGLMDVEVLSFSRLVDRILDRTGRPKGQPIDDIGKTMLLGRVFKSLKQDGSIFGKGSNRMGFLGIFQDMLREFRQSGIRPEDLEALANETTDPAFVMKLKEIALVYQAYESRLTASFVDEGHLYEQAAQKIQSLPDLKASRLFIDGFSGFTHQEYILIEAILGGGGTVTLAITNDTASGASAKLVADEAVFEPARKTLRKLEEVAERVSTPVIHSPVAHTWEALGQQSPDLRHLETSLYAWPTRKYKQKPEQLQMGHMASPYAEVEKVAIKILQLVRDKEARYRDMAIVVGGMDEYGPLISRVFAEYDIPCFLDEKRPIRSNPVVKALDAALHAAIRRYRHDDLFCLIKSGMVQQVDRDTAERLENFCLAQGIKGFKWLKPWDNAQAFHMEPEQLEILESARVSIIEPLRTLEKALKKGGTMKEIVEALYTYMEVMGFFVLLQERIELLKAQGDFETAAEYAQTWNMVMAIFNQAVLVSESDSVTGEELLEILQTGFDTYRVGVIPPSSDKIQVGSFDRSVFGRKPWLFALGMNDGKVPRIKTTSGVLTNNDKIRIKDKGFFVRSELSEVNSEEAYALYNILTSADRALWISYAQSDKDGKALRPSVLVERMKKIFPELKVQQGIGEEDLLDYLSRPQATLRHMIAQERDQLEVPKAQSQFWGSVKSWFVDHPEWGRKLDHALSGLHHDNHQSRLDEEVAELVFPKPLTSSVSRLEQFSSCPFSHLVKYGLRPEERREFELAMPDMGIIFHKAVELYGKDLLNDLAGTLALSKEALEGRIATYVEGAVDSYGGRIFTDTAYGRFAVGRIKRVALKAASTIADHIQKGRFRPQSYELGFGGVQEGNLPPLILDAGESGKIVLEGRIDRVDFFDGDDGMTFVRVIDYKSGAKSFDASEVLNGLQLQLMLYLDAVLVNASCFRKDELHPAGAFYFRIHDPLLSTAEEDPSILASEMRKALKMDGAIIKDLTVIKAMDGELVESQDSDVVPVKLKKDGEPGENGRLFDQQEFKALIRYAERKATDLGQSILQGYMKAEPVKNGERTACDNCGYKGICQFDTRLEDNQFKVIKKMDKQTVSELLKNQGNEKGVE